MSDTNNIDIKDLPLTQNETQNQNSDAAPGAAPRRVKVIFCLPGREFNRHFLISWTRLIMMCAESNIDVVLSQSYDSMVHFARSRCLRGDNRAGPDQKPFQGQVEYDAMFWIDSDILFQPEHVLKILTSPHEVTSGLYMMEDMQRFAVVKDWDVQHFANNGSFHFITPDDINVYNETTGQQYMSVAYAGMGFMMIKKGVIERLTYPWFASPPYLIGKTNEGGDMLDIMSEDVYFCRKLKENNIDIMVDTSVRVGHLKTIPI